MKLKKSLIFLSACFILFSTSCRKQSNSAPRFESQQVKTHALLTDRDPSNEENPYDDAGYYHNLGMESVKAFLVNNPSASEEDMLEHVEDWAYTTLSEDLDLPNASTLLSAISSYEHPDAAIQTHLSSIYDILNGLPSYDDYDDLKVDLINIEATVYSSATLSNSQKEVILTTASVARYSASYWWEYKTNTAATDKAKDVAIADAVGSVSGFTDNARLGGAVGASAMRAWEDLKYWWNN